MKDIYEMINDIEIDESEFQEFQVSEIEKGRTKKNLRKSLKNEELKHKKRLNKKKIAVVAAITIFCATTAVAIKPAIAANIPIIGELFKKNLVSVNKQYADYIDMIGKTKSCEGIDVTFESAAADDNMLMLNFIVKNNNKEIKDKYTDALLIPTDMKVNGKDVSTGAGASWEFIDNNTIRVLKKINWANDKLPNKMNIDINISELFGKSGDWSVKFYIDKSKQADKTVEKKVRTKFELNGEKGEISSVNISPLTVRINGEGEFSDYATGKGLDFIVLDQNGNGLLWNGSQGSKNGAFSTYKWSHTFISNSDMKGITIIPVEKTGNENRGKLPAVKLNMNDIKPFQLSIDEDRSISIKDYFIDEDYLIIKYNEKYFGKDSLRQSADLSIYVTVDDKEDKSDDTEKRAELYGKYNDSKHRMELIKVGASRDIKVGTYDGSNVKLLKDKSITVDINK